MPVGDDRQRHPERSAKYPLKPPPLSVILHEKRCLDTNLGLRKLPTLRTPYPVGRAGAAKHDKVYCSQFLTRQHRSLTVFIERAEMKWFSRYAS